MTGFLRANTAKVAGAILGWSRPTPRRLHLWLRHVPVTMAECLNALGRRARHATRRVGRRVCDARACDATRFVSADAARVTTHFITHVRVHRDGLTLRPLNITHDKRQHTIAHLSAARQSRDRSHHCDEPTNEGGLAPFLVRRSSLTSGLPSPLAALADCAACCTLRMPPAPLAPP